MQPPPGYENKDEKPNRYKESKIIITREEALDALRRVFKSIMQILGVLVFANGLYGNIDEDHSRTSHLVL